MYDIIKAKFLIIILQRISLQFFNSNIKCDFIRFKKRIPLFNLQTSKDEE